MASSITASKPKILCFGEPSWADASHMAEFKKIFDVTVIRPTDRAGTIQEVVNTVATSGPFYGAMLLMGNSAYDPFDAELFAPLLPSLKIVSCVNAGYSEFDLEWFTKNGVYVTNTLNAVAEATADITIFLILAVLRDTSSNEKLVRQGSWKSAKVPPRDPNGLMLGIVGMGKIGKHVARKAAVFGMKIQYYNRSRVAEDEESKLGVTYCKQLGDLLQTSDVVSINCPLTESTRGLVGEKEFAQMKDGVFLVNTGRGPVVDEKALIASLWSGKVARAGLDVFDNEPKINPFFRGSEKCIVQPHIGSWTDVAWKNAYHEVIDNISALHTSGKPVSPVNEV